MQIILFIVILLVALSAFALTIWVKEHADLFRFRESLINKERRGVKNLLAAVIVPLIKKIHSPILRSRINQLLLKSGDRDRISDNEWMASLLIYFVFLLILFLLFGYSLISAAGLAIIATTIYVGGNLYHKITKRRSEVSQNLPLVLDMLS